MSTVAKCGMIKDAIDVRLSISNAAIFTLPSTKRGKTVVKVHSKAIDHAKLTSDNANHGNLTCDSIQQPLLFTKPLYGLLKTVQLKINEDKVSLR